MKFSLSLLVIGSISMTFASNDPIEKRNEKNSTKKMEKTLNGFCNFIPSGYSVIENDTFSVQSFYMSTSEITNFQYQEFLYDLKAKGELEKLEIARVDTMGWSKHFPSLESEDRFYATHPAYRDYPVVNISKEAALLYCDWLSNKYKEIYGDHISIKFRLPTRAEWIRAARGSFHSQEYAWNDNSILSTEGEYRANHLAVESQNIRRNPSTGNLEVVPMDDLLTPIYIGDNAMLTARVESYDPNDFGIYDLNGNVSEMIADGDFAVGGSWRSPGYDVRNESIEDFNTSSPTVGFRVVATYISPE